MVIGAERDRHASGLAANCFDNAAATSSAASGGGEETFSAVEIYFSFSKKIPENFRDA